MAFRGQALSAIQRTPICIELLSDGNKMSSKDEIHMLSCFFTSRSFVTVAVADLSVIFSVCNIQRWVGVEDHAITTSFSVSVSLHRGRKKETLGLGCAFCRGNASNQIRKWGFWELGNGLFPKWPLLTDEVRHLSQSTLNSPLLNEQTPVKHVVAFKAIPTSGHITLWSVVQMSGLPTGNVKGITRKGLILVNPWSPSIKPVYCVVGPVFT